MIDEHTVKCLISSCPSMEELLFEQCWGLKKLQISGLHRLKTLEVRHHESEFETIDIQASSLHMFQLANFTGQPMSCIKMDACQNLRTLSLLYSAVECKWFHDFMSKFPLLEDLQLYSCRLSESFEILSCPLRRLTIHHCRSLMEISTDAPNLLSFSYKGELNSHLLSTRLSGKSKCRIGVSHPDDVDAYWFHNLRKLLSRINHLEFLELQIMFGKYPVDREEFRQVPLSLSHKVNHLKLRIDSLISYYPALIDSLSSNYPALIDGLFWCCQPQAVSLELNSTLLDFKYKSDFTKYLYQKLMHQKDIHGRGADHAKHLCHYVKDVTIDICKRMQGTRRPVHLDSLLDALPTLSASEEIIFKSNTCFKIQRSSDNILLRWKSSQAFMPLFQN